MRVVIDGYHLPGRTSCTREGELLEDVHVGVQVRRDPDQLVPGDADDARWEIDVGVVVGPDGAPDFRGPAVHGKRGARFLYLTWGNVETDGEFTMFARAKLMLNRIDEDLIRDADDDERHLHGRIHLTADSGGPRCARVDPPALEWSVG